MTSEARSAREALAQQLRWQADGCAELGSSLYADLLARAADDALAGGPIAQVLAGYEHRSRSSVLPLRLLGGVHAAVLRGEAPELAVHYPSAGGSYGEPDAAWSDFLTFVGAHVTELRGWLDQPPQTNEVGRAAALFGALVHALAEVRLPVRLVEIGASAGLNLRADHYRYLASDGSGCGPADSPVVLRDAWRGRPVPDVEVDVVSRAGCDVAPVDATSDEGRLRLMAYVWPDQVERVARLRGALEVAARVPADVVRASAAEFLDGLELVDGTLTVVWHSVMWQYLGADERRAVERRLGELGSRATPGAALARIAFEPRSRTPGTEPEWLVTVQSWPSSSGERVLGVAAPHGVPVHWE